MTRGNQREQDRQKNLKKQQDAKKGTNLPPGMTFRQKQEADAQIMRDKVKKAAEKTSTSPPPTTTATSTAAATSASSTISSASKK